MRQAHTLSRVGETRPVLGKQKRESGKKPARKPSNLRQEGEKWHQMGGKEVFFFRENTSRISLGLVC